MSIPLGCLTAVTGVSGSGKSSLVTQALPDLLHKSLSSEVDSASIDASSETQSSTAADPLFSSPTAETTRARSKRSSNAWVVLLGPGAPATARNAAPRARSPVMGRALSWAWNSHVLAHRL